MKKIRIAILDSGVNIFHKEFQTHQLIGYSLHLKNGIVHRYPSFNDESGHGTAIYSIIFNIVKNYNVEIVNIKIYDNNHEMEMNEFCSYIDYIQKNDFFDIINISMGVIRSGSTYVLRDLCDQLTKQGSIIVSAFDNNGAVSFPAALNNVIGVDGSNNFLGNELYWDNTNGVINVYGKLTNRIVPWVTPEYTVVKGTSFLCGYVTAQIAIGLLNGRVFDLPKNYDLNFGCSLPDMKFQIKRAAVFPFNKEIHSIARYEEKLSFEIIDYYAPRETGHVNKSISTITDIKNNHHIIKNIKDIDWNSFDTLILGHCEEMMDILKRDYRKDLVKGALEHQKNIYSFEPLDKYLESTELLNNKIFVPYLNDLMVPNIQGKLFFTNKPVICVIGTNSQQGKFTLQLLLRYKFQELGYNIGQIGTEPSALLFGMDSVFPSGYKTTLYLDRANVYAAVNRMIWEITEKDVDLILSGTQTWMLPYFNSNIKQYPLIQRPFLEALMPDLIIITVNAYDDLLFVKRTISMVEGLVGAKVIAAVCFPITYTTNWRGTFGQKEHISNTDFEQLKADYKKHLNLNLYLLDDEHTINNLISDIINYLQ